jgi:NAD(P)-dependent dehydrogenase (short-subunit alcohol dehydrogenase family)
MKLDHGDFASVSAFVTEFEKEHDRLDVFVANAGINTMEFTLTKDGHESTYVRLRERYCASLTWTRSAFK